MKRVVYIDKFNIQKSMKALNFKAWKQWPQFPPSSPLLVFLAPSLAVRPYVTMKSAARAKYSYSIVFLNRRTDGTPSEVQKFFNRRTDSNPSEVQKFLNRRTNSTSSEVQKFLNRRTDSTSSEVQKFLNRRTYSNPSEVQQVDTRLFLVCLLEMLKRNQKYLMSICCQEPVKALSLLCPCCR